LRELAAKRNDLAGYIEHNTAFLDIKEEIRGQDAMRKMAMLEAEQHIEAERIEKEKHRALLHNTLPPSIADRVLRGEQVNDAYENAAVLFMDLVGFTSISSALDPNDVVKLLSKVFTRCDDIVSRHGLMKIKTIGDSYMAVSFPDSEQSHVPNAHLQLAAMTAVDMLRELPAVTSPLVAELPLHLEGPIQVRIGLHCGPLVAGIVGEQRVQYDVWGDTVNIASRMESTGEPGRIQVSEQFANSLDSDPWTVVPRGEVNIKGKGQMKTYWLEGM